MSSFGNLFAMKNQAQGGAGLAGIPTWKLLAASALSNIGKPGAGLNPIQLIMAQKDAQKEQEEQQGLVQIAQMGKYDQNAGTAINPLLGRPSPQMAQSPQSKLGALAETNPLVAKALATQNLQDLMGGGGFSGTLKPGETAFERGRIVASLPADGPKPITNPKDAAFLQWSALNPNKNPAEFEAAWNSATQKQSGAIETYRMLTPQEVNARGLPDGFTYQVNERSGQVTKLTEPKQDKPTQGENTSSYHATRIASGLQDLKEVLSRNKGAATTLVPGDNAVSRYFRGEDENIVQNALAEMGDALLTLGTGAAYTQIQFDNQWKANMPALNDTDEILRRKFGRIEQLYERAKKNAGAAGVDLPSISSIAELYKPKQKQPANRAGWRGWSMEVVQE